MITTIVIVGTTAALAGLIALDLELEGGLLGGSGDIETARTMTFTTIVLAQVFNAFNSRSSTVSAFVRPFANRILLLAIVVTVLLQVAVVYLPGLSTAFDTQPLDAEQWAICWVLASLVLWAEELHKLIARRMRARA
jgi:magnesium-transporting ATPase (P-type)